MLTGNGHSIFNTVQVALESATARVNESIERDKLGPKISGSDEGLLLNWPGGLRGFK